ncbi:HAD-IIB family hydrolase [Aestuariivirga sp. YIM B02566]|uniref:HAD-IIB family hydrolase n=1 Tax=Taklimakanibacter albus TaxID=2800327 RepID=A0ACC5R4H8_9HYPH|nr:HAD-IIB family hydrolase [Aestuariivirga sp. YIM B02566]MBK1867532.1 HAD-IIB family hydrolase [Aestuariivirga sp. YIM B02566]
MLPLASCPPSELRAVKAILTDIDDTLTLHGRLPAIAYRALEDLRRTGLVVIPITGRPAGWCDHIARMWPVDGIVGENGAFYFRYDDKSRKMQRVYGQPAEERLANSARLEKLGARILTEFPGTAIASDQAYREIDIAIDFCEDVPALPLATAERIRQAFEAEGAVAKVSSIHVNAWFGHHDKLTMTRRMLKECFGIDTEREKQHIVYAGDSPNDAPMFAFFPNSVGVANVMPYKEIMAHLPRYVTKAEGGEGFAELARALLEARHG